MVERQPESSLQEVVGAPDMSRLAAEDKLKQCAAMSTKPASSTSS